jgi:hypothetical protein
MHSLDVDVEVMLVVEVFSTGAKGTGMGRGSPTFYRHVSPKGSLPLKSSGASGTTESFQSKEALL